MRSTTEEGPYANCHGLRREILEEFLVYDPERGTLNWLGRFGRGGAKIRTPVVSLRLALFGVTRNTLGIICLLKANRLPAGRIVFQDGNPKNWSWANICPADWRPHDEDSALS